MLCPVRTLYVFRPFVNAQCSMLQTIIAKNVNMLQENAKDSGNEKSSQLTRTEITPVNALLEKDDKSTLVKKEKGATSIESCVEATKRPNESKVSPLSPTLKVENPATLAQEVQTSNSKTAVTTPKVKIHFIAVGSAPLMKKSKFQIPGKESFGSLQLKMRKLLQLTDSSPLFLYLHQSFVPSPEDLIGDLGDLFSVRGELKIHYSLQEAWG